MIYLHNKIDNLYFDHYYDDEIIINFRIQNCNDIFDLHRMYQNVLKKRKCTIK